MQIPDREELEHIIAVVTWENVKFRERLHKGGEKMGSKLTVTAQLMKIRAAKAEYAREWRRKNPEKAKEIQSRYWLRQAEKLAVENK